MGREDVAGVGADDHIGAVDGIDGEVGNALKRPLRVGSRKAVSRLEQVERAADVIDLEEVGVEGTTAKSSPSESGVQYWSSVPSYTLLIDGHAGAA